MSQTLNVDQSIRYVLSKNFNVLIVRTYIAVILIFNPISFDDRLFSGKPIVISLFFLLLAQLRVVEDYVLFC